MWEFALGLGVGMEVRERRRNEWIKMDDSCRTGVVWRRKLRTSLSSVTIMIRDHNVSLICMMASSGDTQQQ